jgi:hypothetical protein
MEQQIIEWSFNTLNQVKLFHWATTSFSVHKALDSLHDDLSALVDQLVETYIGNGRRQPLKLFHVATEAHTNVAELIPFLYEKYTELKKVRQGLRQSELQNIVDEMLTTLNQVQYLLQLS